MGLPHFAILYVPCLAGPGAPPDQGQTSHSSNLICLPLIFFNLPTVSKTVPLRKVPPSPIYFLLVSQLNSHQMISYCLTTVLLKWKTGKLNFYDTSILWCPTASCTAFHTMWKSYRDGLPPAVTRFHTRDDVISARQLWEGSLPSTVCKLLVYGDSYRQDLVKNWTQFRQLYPTHRITWS